MGSALKSDLDPRRSVRTRVGLAFGGCALILALLLSLVVGRISRDRLEEQTGARLAELANQTVDKLDRQMFERYKDVEVLDVAAPVLDAEGDVRGVLAVHPSWEWAREVQASLLESAGSERGVEMLILAADGRILLQPDGAMGPFEAPPVNSVALARSGTSGHLAEPWPDGIEYVTGYAESRGYRSYAGLGWIVLIRQSSALALAPAREIQAAIVGWGLAFGVVFALLGTFIADRIVIPIRRLATAAQRIQRGERGVEVPTVQGTDEIATLAHGFRDMVASLTEHEQQLQDLNQRLEQRVRERTREARTLALVARHTDNAVIVADGRQRIEWVNEGFTRLTGYSLADALGRLPFDLVQARVGDATPTVTLPIQLGGDAAKTVEQQWHTKSGDQPWVAVEYQRILGDDGETTNYVFLGRDVSARRQVEQRLRHDALHDTLTGLPNRALLLDRLDHVIRRSQRELEGRFALMFVDLDGFKAVNDRLGHAVGDLLLIAVARRLESCLRPGDTVARIGGDELAILVESGNPAEAAPRIADRVLDHLCRPYEAEGHRVVIGASIGVALGGEPEATSASVLRKADAAMYVAKRSGKGRWVMYDRSMAAEPSRQEIRAHETAPAAAPEARTA